MPAHVRRLRLRRTTTWFARVPILPDRCALLAMRGNAGLKKRWSRGGKAGVQVYLVRRVLPGLPVPRVPLVQVALLVRLGRSVLLEA